MLEKVELDGPRWSCEDQGCADCAQRKGYKLEGHWHKLNDRFEGLRSGISLDCAETPLGEGSAGIAVGSFFGKEPQRSSSGHSDVRIATPR